MGEEKPQFMKEIEGKTFEEMKELFLRGETPDGIKKKSLQLCAEYLSGSWKNLTVDQIKFRRISGGLTNQLYYCGLADDVLTTGDEPREVAIKLYGKKWFMNDENNERLNDLIIVLLASEYNVGPKVYGVFGGGEVIEYVESHQFRVKEQTDPQTSNELAIKLAQFHSLKPPIAKDTNWLSIFLYQFYKKAYDLFPIDEIIAEIKAENLMKTNFKEEFKWLLNAIEAIDSPIVFSHNDFRGSNILVREKVDADNKRITLCDFEYSAYYHRGYDFATYFFEWGRSSFADKAPFPSDEIIGQFIEGYIRESVRIHGEEFSLNEQNSVQHLIKETKVFVLAAEMFIIMFLYASEEMFFNSTKKDYLIGANSHIVDYFEYKKKFQEEGILPL